MANQRPLYIQYLDYGNRHEVLSRSDSDPNCNRRGAEKAAKDYGLPVLVYEVKPDGRERFLYRVDPLNDKENTSK